MVDQPVPGPALHPALRPVSFLLGTWRGTGQGDYPTIEPFGFREELSYSHDGRPFLSVVQRTWSSEDGRALHCETGYLRCPEPGAAELVLAHNTGIVEIEDGAVEATSLILSSRVIGSTESAKSVGTLRRSIEVRNDELSYVLEMAAVGVPLVHHLSAVLRRT